jgi:hypothetical protein
VDSDSRYPATANGLTNGGGLRPRCIRLTQLQNSTPPNFREGQTPAHAAGQRHRRERALQQGAVDTHGGNAEAGGLTRRCETIMHLLLILLLVVAVYKIATAGHTSSRATARGTAMGLPGRFAIDRDHLLVTFAACRALTADEPVVFFLAIDAHHLAAGAAPGGIFVSSLTPSPQTPAPAAYLTRVRTMTPS